MRLALSHAGVHAPPPISHVRRMGVSSRPRARSSSTCSACRSCPDAYFGLLQHLRAPCHGEGVNAHSTTYCPGCGHGLAHKYLAEAIDDSGPKTGLFSSRLSVARCSCTTTSTSAIRRPRMDEPRPWRSSQDRQPGVDRDRLPGRRRPRVHRASGDHKHGTARIPITVIFINNSVYGMTGGQMAPTTLMGQRTTTTLEGGHPAPDNP